MILIIVANGTAERAVVGELARRGTVARVLTETHRAEATYELCSTAQPIDRHGYGRGSIGGRRGRN